MEHASINEVPDPGPLVADRSRIAVCEEFLAATEVRLLRQFARARAESFRPSTVFDPLSGKQVVSLSVRRSRVLLGIEPFRSLIEHALMRNLRWVQDALCEPPFEPKRIEIQMTVSKPGEFFCRHTDSGAGANRSRAVTFVVFLQDDPKLFSGGELCIYETPRSGLARVHRIEPSQNRVVFFPAALPHEVMPLKGEESGRLTACRLTLNGWIHK
jgi:hypothetical protein